MSRTQNASRNMVWGILGKLVSLGLPFITRTVIIYSMGMQYAGLGSLFSAILQVLSFAELGIGSALIFSMYKPIAEGDDAKVCALLNFYRKTYRIIGTVTLAAGAALMPFLHRLIAGDIPEDLNITVLYCIYLVNNVAGYYLFAYKQALFVASQRMDVVSKVSMGLQAASGLVQIAIVLLFRNYYAYTIVLPVLTCANNFCIGYLADRYYPQYKCRGKIEQTELRSIESKVGGMVFQRIGGIVLTSVDTLVISAVLGLTSLALYQNYYFIISALFGFLEVAMQSIVAGVGNSVAVETVEKNYLDFKKFNFLYVWVVAWCMVCLLCLYQPFMRIWVGEQNMFGREMVVLFALYFFVHKWCDMLYVYQEACGIWWETKFVPLTAAMVNLTVNLILVRIIGLPGILISTIVAVVFVYDVGYAGVLFKTYFKSIKKGAFQYWGRQFFYLAVAAAAAVITCGLCSMVQAESPWVQLIFNGILCVIVPNALFALAWCRLPEFRSAAEMVNMLFRKKMGKEC